MTNKDALTFINFWIRELLHAGHENADEKSKILKIIRKEITMGLDLGLITENESYVESGMAKLMGNRYPELKIRSIDGLTVPSNIEENGLKEIKEYIEQNPIKVSYADYVHCTKLVKYFATRRIALPIKTVENIINYKSNIIFENGKFLLKNMDAKDEK